MPMDRSVSYAERGATYGGGPGANLRSYSASYAPRAAPPSKVSRARSTTSACSRPAAPPAVQRSGSVRPVSGGLNLRSYSASYAASYGPTLDAAAGAGAGGGGGGQGLKRSGSVTNWSASGRRSVNLRGYTPSFAALDDTAAAPPAAVPAATARKIDDAELRRKKRLVVYKVYDVEGKLRSSVRRGVGWIKSRCSRVVYGLW